MAPREDRFGIRIRRPGFRRITVEKKTSEAQIRASRAWEKRNPEKTKMDNYRRTARLFIKTYATKRDMADFQALFERENEHAR